MQTFDDLIPKSTKLTIAAARDIAASSAIVADSFCSFEGTAATTVTKSDIEQGYDD